MSKKLSKNHVAVWEIHVVGYGMFEHVGTKEEAKLRAAEKGEWEGSTGRVKLKREASEADIKWYAEHGASDVDLIEDKACPKCDVLWERRSPWCYDHGGVGVGCGHKFEV